MHFTHCYPQVTWYACLILLGHRSSLEFVPGLL